ncbi:oligopeptidase B Serine peptidase. MEROPS family S09A [Devosia lucknowensis]|uniref:Oligopeptidase B Serine peptidase. MEROPS family S09A n=1 Tax=Devosia lucknowensis TaxID=1096929 RepID=A0A1Y6EE57_9HYPH|nr:S9 family peptidase [Devosia lucknowensis]SMQ60878.1 oligopeptidase B Serine peptidase. MEROPS family S09A [Devosia lucknowensis]
MTKLTPPVAKRVPHSHTHHNVTRDDPYAWLRAENWQEVMQKPESLDPQIRSYLDDENSFYEAEFGKPTADLQEKIYREIRGRIKEDDSGVALPDRDWAYNTRMLEGKQYPLIVRTPRAGGDETVLLDCNLEAGEGYFGFGGASHDPSHRTLAWAADRAGSEYYDIVLRDIASGEDSSDIIRNTAGSYVWSNDSRALYYTEYDDNHRPYRIRRHDLGTDQAVDPIIYEEKDPGFFVGVGKTLSDKFIVIDAHDHQTSEVWLIDARQGGEPRLVAPRVVDREYEVDEREGVLYIRTNADGAEDYKIVTVAADAPDASNWVDLVPHREGILILDVALLRNHLLRLERQDGLPRIVARDLRSGKEETVDFAEEAYSLGMSTGYEFDTSVFRLSYSSPTTPQQLFDVDLDTGKRTLLKTQEVPSGHDPADYETRRLFATAADGEQVPVTVLYRKGAVLDGSNPTLLYGYGAYGMSMPASFSVSVLSLVDRGFVYAIAHIRGGMEKGYRWYRQGRREHKTNTFTDFIAAAEMLIAEGFTRKGKIIAQGGSAGGMLMGAVANLRPDLWGGVIAQVPFVDVLNTMLDDTLPLTPPEWPEWGNPITSAEDYERIADYAPYEAVSAQAYPPILALAGLTDPRVTYWEPAKWVAKLRATKLGDAPLYLKTNMGAGHAGASGRFDRLKETAQCYAFAIKSAGLDG